MESLQQGKGVVDQWHQNLEMGMLGGPQNDQSEQIRSLKGTAQQVDFLWGLGGALPVSDGLAADWARVAAGAKDRFSAEGAVEPEAAVIAGVAGPLCA